MSLPRGAYTWVEMREAARRRAKRACLTLLADLVRESGRRTLGEAKAAYRAKNELDL